MLPAVHLRLAMLTACCAISGDGTGLAWAADPYSLCDKFGEYEAVFVGTTHEPVRRQVTLAPDLKPEMLLLYPVTVERTFRGVASPLVYLYRPEPEPPMAAGRTYLIYAERFGVPADILIPIIFEPTEEAATDLEFLESVALTATSGTIHGVVTEGDEHDSDRRRSPLSDVPIRVWSDAYTTDTVTRHDGSFVVSGVPEGLVWVEPLLPDYLTAPKRGKYVKAGSCVSHHIIAAVNGRVSGRVLRHNGTPYNWVVDLMPLDPGRRRRPIEVHANADGEFEFSGQQPGEYLVGVNLEGWPYDPTPATFYPGTSDRAAALPIVLGVGTMRTGLDFRLPAEVARGEVVVQVDTHGTADEVMVCLAGTSEGRGNPGGGYPQFYPNAPIVITVLEGRQYRLVAHVERRSGHSESSEVEVTGTDNRQAVTLVADGPATAHAANDICGPYWHRSRQRKQRAAPAFGAGSGAPPDVSVAPRR